MDTWLIYVDDAELMVCTTVMLHVLINHLPNPGHLLPIVLKFTMMELLYSPYLPPFPQCTPNLLCSM